MRVVQINATCGIGSTGKICTGISEIMDVNNIDNYILCSRSNGHSKGQVCANNRYLKVQALKAKVLGNYGFNSKWATRKMIQKLEQLKPDIVHLHNIHGHDCNLELLFTYFKNQNVRLLWTMHDCWAFTGYCVYFDAAKCGKWKTKCSDCPQRDAYSWFGDKSSQLFRKKQELFKGLDLTIVTPSKWLADRVQESFLKEYPVEVIYNGINLSIFQPLKSSFREKYGIPSSKKVILGVAFEWEYRKGFDVFVELSERLDLLKYQIVLVGTNEQLDKQLPDSVISIHRTNNQAELAELYSAADVFVNPTREEVLGLTNIEANACGTPVITFRTGGSPECIDNTSGTVIEVDDVKALSDEIVRICETSPYTEENCRSRANKFNEYDRYKEYLELYERIKNRGNQEDRTGDSM